MFAGTLPIFASILDAKILLVLEPKLQSWKIVHEGELLSRNMAGWENLIENLLSAMSNRFQVYLEAALKIQNLRTHNNCDACTFLKFKFAYPRWEIELRIVTFVIGRWITKFWQLVSLARTKVLTHSDFLSGCLGQIVVDCRRKPIRILGRSRAITNRTSRTRTHKHAISRFSVL